MRLPVALRIARRELRGGLKGFAVFLLCLSLGVMAIAAVGSVRAAIEAGLAREGAVILGGDAEMEFTYRYANDEERAWMEAQALALSEVVDFRSMAVVSRDTGDDRALTQVKGVDLAYPLLGQVLLDPPIPLAEALRGAGSVPGAVAQKVLVDRLGLSVGDRFRLGTQEFQLSAVLLREPDASSAGFSLGPRLIVYEADLAGSGLLAPGTLYETKYRLILPDNTDLSALASEARGRYRDEGMRWRDARNGAPGVQRFVERMGAFLVLVGIAGLAVGGVGISAAVRAYLAGKIATIATLKTLGAGRGTIFAVYLAQIAVMSLLGIAGGVVLGGVIPLIFGQLLEARLPVPIAIGLYWAPLGEAAVYGLLTALVFTLWPLARSEEIRAAALYRDGGVGAGLPRWPYLLAITTLAAVLIGLAAWWSGIAYLALWSASGICAALAVLLAASWGLRAWARRAARSKALRGRSALRLAASAIGGQGEEAGSVMLSLGLGLAVLAAVGQIDSNMRGAIESDLPDVAPSYFFVDIQPDQLPGFLERVTTDPQVSRVDTAPNLRGVITKINGQPAREVAGNHWVLRGDRGVTYAAEPLENTVITKGQWWGAEYNGPPQISFAAEEAEELGLDLGDKLTVKILGREIEGEITSLRDVDFSTAGIGFVLTMNPQALAGAPHTHIATVYAEEEAEAAILRDLANAFPNITAIRVRDAIDNVTRVLEGLAAATSYGAGATLLTGFVVLIGAASVSERARIYEAAILKTLGATRAAILASFALRSVLLGAAAGLVALLAGTIAGWAVMTFVMEAEFRLDLSNALAIVLGGVGATLLAGLALVWRPLAARPAQILRAQD